jgi:hypothetical protein
MDEGWASEPEGGTSERPEFIPLGYDTEGRVVDIMGNVRSVEAISYALDSFYAHVNVDGQPFELSRHVLFQVNQTIKGKLKKELKKELEGKVGFILRKNIFVEDPDAEGEWFTVQLYRVID